MGERHFYNAYTLDAVLSGLDTLSMPIHPRVAEWAINENARFNRKRPNRQYVHRVRGEWKVKESNPMFKKGGADEGGEYGISDTSMYQTLIRVHGLDKHYTTDLHALNDRFHSEMRTLVREWDRENPNTSKKWLRRYRNRRDIEKDVRDVVKRYGVDAPAIRWVKGWPVSPAVYSPPRKELLLHTWLRNNARRCDMAILALHEIVGHHYQEQRVQTSNASAESCAMSCELLVKDIVGSSAPVIEWKCMRLCRAMLDLRLHARIGDYAIPENIWSVWGSRLGGAFEHIVPLPSETLRVAALPGQALSYVIPSLTSNEGCHPQCVSQQKRPNKKRRRLKPRKSDSESDSDDELQELLSRTNKRPKKSQRSSASSSSAAASAGHVAASTHS